MADEEKKADKPSSPRTVKKSAKKKPTAKKATRRKTAKKAGGKKSVAKKTPAATATATPAEPASASPSPGISASGDASRPAPASAVPYTAGDVESAGSGFLPLWGPLTMLVFVVLIFHYMDDGNNERRQDSVTGAAARAVAMEPDIERAGAAAKADIEETNSAPADGSLTKVESDAPAPLANADVLDALRSASPEQIRSAAEASLAPKSGLSAAPPEDAGELPMDGSMPGTAPNPWAPGSSTGAIGGGSAEPPPPPVIEQGWAPRQSGYPQPPQPQFPYYGWQPPPQGFVPRQNYPGPGYRQAPPSAAYAQPYATPAPYGAPQPYPAPQPYGAPQPGYGAPQTYAPSAQY